MDDPEQNENKEMVTTTYCSLVDMLFMQGNMYKAIMVWDDFLKYAAKEGQETKEYHIALSKHFLPILGNIRKF